MLHTEHENPFYLRLNRNKVPMVRMKGEILLDLPEEITYHYNDPPSIFACSHLHARRDIRGRALWRVIRAPDLVKAPGNSNVRTGP